MGNKILLAGSNAIMLIQTTIIHIGQPLLTTKVLYHSIVLHSAKQKSLGKPS